MRFFPVFLAFWFTLPCYNTGKRRLQKIGASRGKVCQRQKSRDGIAIRRYALRCPVPSSSSIIATMIVISLVMLISCHGKRLLREVLREWLREAVIISLK